MLFRVEDVDGARAVPRARLTGASGGAMIRAVRAAQSPLCQRKDGAERRWERRRRTVLRQFALASFIVLAPSLASAQPAKFQIEEATIEDIQAAILRRELTSTGVLRLYLASKAV